MASTRRFHHMRRALNPEVHDEISEGLERRPEAVADGRCFGVSATTTVGE